MQMHSSFSPYSTDFIMSCGCTVAFFHTLLTMLYDADVIVNSNIVIVFISSLLMVTASNYVYRVQQNCFLCLAFIDAR